MKTLKDILIGTWAGGADDGSGLRTMIYNYGITFNEDGTGIDFCWNKKQSRIEESKCDLLWKCIDHCTIAIRYINDELDPGNWEIIKIEISDFIGAYNSEYLRMVTKGKNTFWNFPEPLYKSKAIGETRGILGRLIRLIKRNKRKIRI